MQLGQDVLVEVLGRRLICGGRGIRRSDGLDDRCRCRDHLRVRRGSALLVLVEVGVGLSFLALILVAFPSEMEGVAGTGADEVALVAMTFLL